MQQCANCGHQNRAGVVFCENCGASLIGKVPLDTKSLDAAEEETEQLGVDSSVLAEVRVQGGSTFEPGTSLRLDIQGSTDPIIFKPKAETIFGRRDPATGAMPDVDLTPFAGYRMGVSRRHAAIRSGENQTLDLWDLGSSNGTFLNEERLNPHRPYRLRDGDEIRLGSMTIRIYFQRDDKLSSRPEAGDLSARPIGLPPAIQDNEPYVGPPRPKTLPADSEMLKSIAETESRVNAGKPEPAEPQLPTPPEPAPAAEEKPAAGPTVPAADSDAKALTEPSATEKAAEAPEKPPVDQPSTEQPSAKEPRAEKPSADKPDAEKPTADEPSIDQPQAKQEPPSDSSSS